MFNKLKKGGAMKTLARSNNRNLFPAIPSLLNNFFNEDWIDSTMANWASVNATLPAVNVKETNNEFLIEVAAPGMKRNDFKVELDNNVLTIGSELEGKEQKNEEEQYARREFAYHSFQRSFTLPQGMVEGEKIAARYENGILYITVPKKEEAKVKPPRQIQIA
jgi:HSP20 family protein